MLLNLGCFVQVTSILCFLFRSSGVVKATYDFTAFDKQLVTDLEPHCLANMRAATVAMEDAWADEVSRATMLKQFGTPAYFTQQDFMCMCLSWLFISLGVLFLLFK